MAGDPFARRERPIPVVVVTRAEARPADAAGTAVIVLGAGAHDHAAGQDCAACSASGDVRAHLFDLGERIRAGDLAVPERILVDASRVRDARRVVEAVAGRLPATALRDHAVARNFRLAEVL